MSGIHAEAPPPIVTEPHGINYATGAQLGKGGFAICHRAERYDGSRPTGHIVALKIVKTKMEPAKLAQKFVSELQIHSKLSHPNIVTFYRAFSYLTNTYVVLELCPNGSLADMLKRRRTLTLPEIRRFVIQICGAVKYLHHRHIVHRDLKTGNLFLDQAMNVKVGDFGLAALLVTEKEMELKRRTTMCGTPNYLAPEILEKGKGHDEKVDLWAIGVIAYTLAVGKAPFHASTKEEIYKKLKTGNYTWPELGGTTNQSSDLRALVSSLLVPEEERPVPDLIVSHNFFKIAYVPASIPVSAKERAPQWPEVALPSPEVLRRGFTDSWYTVCRETGVGEREPGKCFRLPGGKRVRSIVFDIEQDAILGTTPTMPIPKDVVYESTVSPWDASGPSSNGPTVVDLTSSDGLRSSSRAAEIAQPSSRNLKEISHNEVATTRPVVANSRATRDAELMPPPSRPSRTGTVRKGARTISEEAAKQAKLQPHRQVEVLETTSGLKAAVDSTEPTPPVATMKASLARRPKPVPKETNVKRPSSKTQSHEEVQPKAAPVKAAITHKNEDPADAILSLPAPPRMTTKKLPVPRKASGSSPPGSDAISGTDPNTVLERLSTFRDNLAAAISNAATSCRPSADTEPLPFVSRWVDYSRKHGMGYVLSDGTVGCIVNATSRFGGTPVTHVLVRNGQKWLSKVGKNMEHAATVPLEIFEECGAAGLRRKVFKGLGSVKEGPLKDEADRRRMLEVLWVKFGRYMAKSMDEDEVDPEAGRSERFIRFYQRVGSVGVWAYTDGCMQVHFPDHTKLVLSPSGTQISATCISPEAAAYLQSNADLLPHHVNSREVFSDSITALLHEGGRVRARIVKANALKEKLEFVLELVEQWTENEGLGRLAGQEGCREGKRLVWEGLGTSRARKADCVSVGRYGGDVLS